MTQSEKNLNALQEYIQQKNAEDNGSVWTFQTSIKYHNKKTGNNYTVTDNVVASVDYSYNDMKVHVDNMPEADDIFLEWSTKFGVWKFQNGVLTINGIDSTGKKGNYTVTML